MQTKAKIDLTSGTVLDWVLPSDTGLDIIETPLTEPLYKPKWTGKVIEDEEGNQIMGEGEWVEGATQEEIDEITRPQPQEPSEIDLLHAQVQASSDYVDLLEEVVVELIQEVYK